jgi:hypothetical protein
VEKFTFDGIGSLCRYLYDFCANLSTVTKPKYSIHDHLDPKQSKHLVACNGMRTSAISLLRNGQLDTLALWQRDPWLLGTDDEDVALTGSERVVYGILDVDNVETTIVTLSVSDDTNTTHVTTTSDHGDNSSVELDEVGDLASSKLNLHGVVDLDGWVGVTDTTQRKICQHFWGNCIATVDLAPINRSRWIDQSLDQRLNDV